MFSLKPSFLHLTDYVARQRLYAVTNVFWTSFTNAYSDVHQSRFTFSATNAVWPIHRSRSLHGSVHCRNITGGGCILCNYEEESLWLEITVYRKITLRWWSLTTWLFIFALVFSYFILISWQSNYSPTKNILKCPPQPGVELAIDWLRVHCSYHRAT